jgi:hypothetical protein
METPQFMRSGLLYREQKENNILTLTLACSFLVLLEAHRRQDMESPWTWIYPHRNPNHADLRGVYPNEAEAREYRGLVLVPFYDPHRGSNVWGWWELRHKISNDSILFIRADGDEMAEEYGAKVAEMANWEHMRNVPEWTSPPHSYALIDYLRSTYQVFYQPNHQALWERPVSDVEKVEDWEEDVPYADKA